MLMMVGTASFGIILLMGALAIHSIDTVFFSCLSFNFLFLPFLFSPIYTQFITNFTFMTNLLFYGFYVIFYHYYKIFLDFLSKFIYFSDCEIFQKNYNSV